MKTGRFLAAFLLLVPGAALAQSEGVATFKMLMAATADKGQGASKPQGTLKMAFSKTAARMDIRMDIASMGAGRPSAGAGDHAPADFSMTTIVQFAQPDKIFILNDRQKSYSVMDVSKAREQAVRSNDTWTLKRTGRDTVAGLSCEKAVVTSSRGKAVEICVAMDLPVSNAWWSAMNRRQGGNDLWIKAMADAGLKGFPVRIRYLGQGRENVEMELVSLDRHPLPSSAFEIPAGYKETSMLGAMGMTPEQQKSMNEALAKMTPEQRKAYEDAMKKAQSQ